MWCVSIHSIKLYYLETAYSPVKDACLLQHVAQIDVCVQEVRIQGDRFLEVVDGQPDLALRIEHAAQIAPGHREIGTRFNRLKIAGLMFFVSFFVCV